MKKYTLGIDIGGTNTDAVIIDQKKNIIAFCKTPTTFPLSLGLQKALEQVCTKSQLQPKEINNIFIGTTQATNALLQKNDLLKVGIIRLATDCTQSLVPFCTWPTDLAQQINAGFIIVAGGYECDGREIAPINSEEIKQATKKLLSQGMQSLAIIGVFSPLNPEQENNTAEICKKIVGKDFPISLSHNIGGINFLERENATIINSTLKYCIQHGFSDLQALINEMGFTCKLQITQNNGTIISLEQATQYPVLTISSGPTNSFNGALHLTQLSDAIIVDIGGTSTDVGIALHGFARRSLTASSIAGIPLNFAMPDVISIAIGGGSYITQQHDKITVGPQSCAKNLREESLVFGGKHMTLTDIAISKKFIDIPEALNQNLEIPQNIADDVIQQVEVKIMKLCAQMAGKYKNLPIILIGGGARLFANSPLASKVHIPDLASIANALGAALAQVSGSIDQVVSLQNREKTLKELEEQAKKAAIQAGARLTELRIAEQQIIPYHYTTNDLARVKITVTGPLTS